VIVSTKTQEADRVWGLRQGAVSYLTKPVTDGDLVSAVRAALAR
jgi:twitching motility two-component system response regulator PilH